MKKKVGLSVLAILCAVFMPLHVSAASGEIFGSSSATMAAGTTTENGGTVKIQNKEGNTKIYLGANVTSGKLTTYKAHIDLENSNFTFKSFTKESGWSGTIKASATGNGIDVDLTSTNGIDGRKLVATITLDVSDAAASTENCTMRLTAINDTPTTTPKCQIVDNKYYDANGNEVSKEAYDKSCTTPENPQTGSFLPFTIIFGGIGVAAILYLITKKNNKIYHI